MPLTSEEQAKLEKRFQALEEKMSKVERRGRLNQLLRRGDPSIKLGVRLEDLAEPPLDVFNVLDFGARADGGSDDRGSIQRALDAAADVSGLVLIPKGTCVIASSLSIASNVVLSGQGWGSVIKTTGTGFAAIVNSDQTNGNDGIAIRNLKLDYSSVSDGDRGIDLTTADVVNGVVDNCTVDNVWILGGHDGLSGSTTTDAIIIGGISRGSGSNLCTNNHIRNCRIQGSFGAGARLKLCKHSSVTHSFCDTSKYGFFIQTNSASCLVSNCIVNATHNICIAIESSAINITIADNICQGSVTGRGINTEQSCQEIKIDGNQCLSNGAEGIRMHDCTKGSINGNLCRDNSGTGMSVGASRRVTINDNSCISNDADGIRISESVDGTCNSNYCINNNQGETAGFSGIRLINDEGDTACERWALVGNRCHDTQGTRTQIYGISETSDSDNNVFVGNQLQGNKTGALNTVGAAALEAHNKGDTTHDTS